MIIKPDCVYYGWYRYGQKEHPGCYKTKKVSRCSGWDKCKKGYVPKDKHLEITHNNTKTFYYQANSIALANLFSGLFYGEQRKFENNKEGEAHAKRRRKKGHYHFIQRPVDHVIRLLQAARAYFSKIGADNYSIHNPDGKKPMFLDAGCGVGNIVMLAHAVGFDAYGIEYDLKTLNRGKKLFEQFRLDPGRLMKGDILEFNNYHIYDVIYTYCPMVNHKLEQQFEDKARREAKKGAIFIGMGTQSNYTDPVTGERLFFQRQAVTIAGDDAYLSMYIKL